MVLDVWHCQGVFTSLNFLCLFGENVHAQLFPFPWFLMNIVAKNQCFFGFSIHFCFIVAAGAVCDNAATVAVAVELDPTQCQCRQCGVPLWMDVVHLTRCCHLPFGMDAKVLIFVCCGLVSKNLATDTNKIPTQ